MAAPTAHTSVHTASDKLDERPSSQQNDTPTATMADQKLGWTKTWETELVTPTESPPSSQASTQQTPGRLAQLQSMLKRRIQQQREPVWRPSALNVRPLLGLFALGVSVLCMCVALAILLASNKQPIARWPIQPTVYLAIAAALANVALGFARFVAAPLSWWHTALRGSNLRELERQWEASHSVLLAFKHHYRMGFAGFATILAALMMIDGPLLQKATSVQVETSSSNITLALNLTLEVGAWEHDACLRVAC